MNLFRNATEAIYAQSNTLYNQIQQKKNITWTCHMENKENSDVVLSLPNCNYMLLAEFIMIVGAPQLIQIIYKNASIDTL